jgi:hypothetical protein
LAYLEDHCSAKRREVFSLSSNEAGKGILTAAGRNNLLTLQQTASLTNTTQTSLATEQSVSSALDDATAFFATSSLNNRAVDLTSLKDSIEKLNRRKVSLIITKSNSDMSERSTLAVQFDSLLTQTDTLENDPSFGGSDLIQGASNNLTVTFNENGTSTLTASAIDSPSGTAGINIAAAGNNFLNDSDIITVLTAVSNAVTTLRTTPATLASNATSLQTGFQFAQELANGRQDLSFALRREGQRVDAELLWGLRG